MGEGLFASRIVAVEWGLSEGKRLRHAGSNARLGEHGVTVRVPFARLTTDNSSTGIGHSRATAQQAQGLIGCTLAELFAPGRGRTSLGATF